MKAAVTFGQRYAHEPHPSSPLINDRSFVVVEGSDEMHARMVAFSLLGQHWAFIYPYEDDEGNPNLDFQRQIREYGLTEVRLGEEQK